MFCLYPIAQHRNLQKLLFVVMFEYGKILKKGPPHPRAPPKNRLICFNICNCTEMKDKFTFSLFMFLSIALSAD